MTTQLAPLLAKRLHRISGHSSKPEILFLSSYPPRECGIATFSQDLFHAIQEKFNHSCSLKVCALENRADPPDYPEEVKYILNTNDRFEYLKLAAQLNADRNLDLINIQHEFGLFGGEYGDYILPFLSALQKPVVTTFHTVLPLPPYHLSTLVREIAELSACIVVMTHNSARLLETQYGIPKEKIMVIPHGTHLVSSFDEEKMKRKHGFADRFIFSTFGLISSGKSIETALDALPAIIAQYPDVLYLVIGKTHPEIVKNEGERYREFLQQKVTDLNLQEHVRFINRYLSLEELLEYLQLTDIYLFTSRDPHQAVSGTFAYALSCACPVISTPIPHAVEMLDGAGIIVDFQDPTALAQAAIRLIGDPALQKEMQLNALHRISPSSWQNSAVAHAKLFKRMAQDMIQLKYEIPVISLEHIRRMTTDFGMIQFAGISVPDLDSGYTLDDNARALIAMVRRYQSSSDPKVLELIGIYLDFILFCQQPDGTFLNYVDKNRQFFEKNSDENLEDSNGRAIWALGELLSHNLLLPTDMLEKAGMAIQKSLLQVIKMHSPRAIAFSIKGLYFYDLVRQHNVLKQTIITLADNLVSKYRGVSGPDWKWFEDYLTYANSVLPEAMLLAYLGTGHQLYGEIAKESFDFLMSVIFRNGQIKVVSNQGWHMKTGTAHEYGEQPIDVAYTIMALGRFYEVYGEETYLNNMEVAFNWFLGKNHLQRIIYNPCTGGCYDGLEQHHVNLNQGAESTISYLMARLAYEKYFNAEREIPVTMTKTLNPI